MQFSFFDYLYVDNHFLIQGHLQKVSKSTTKDLSKSFRPWDSFFMASFSNNFFLHIEIFESNKKSIEKKIYINEDGFFLTYFFLPLEKNYSRLVITLDNIVLRVIEYPLVKKVDKVFFCDWDNTLLKTEYDEFKKAIKTLVMPLNLNEFINHSWDFVKQKIKEGFFLIILSASPYFFRDSIELTLKEGGLSNFFLVLKSPKELFFSYKNIKNQFLYKISKIFFFIEFFLSVEHYFFLGDTKEQDPLIFSFVKHCFEHHFSAWAIESHEGWQALTLKEKVIIKEQLEKIKDKTDKKIESALYNIKTQEIIDYI